MGKRERRVLVCGGRDYANSRAVFDVLSGLHGEEPIGLVINGGAKGADALAAAWARRAEVPCVTHYAKWERHGVRAGAMRNAEMFARWRPHLVVAFPGGSGTAHMVKTANAGGVEVLEVWR